MQSHEPNPAGTKRRRKLRASVACDVCRARKVRCSVATEGPPCINCRLDNIHCTVAQSKRAKLSNTGLRVPGLSGPRHHENDQGGVAEDEIHVGHACVQDSLQAYPDAALTTDAGNEGLRDGRDGASRLPDAPETSAWQIYDANHLPGFIRPIDSSISPRTIDLLSASDVFSLPANHHLSVIVQAYLQAVNPFYPIIDHAMLAALASNELQSYPGQLSLLVLHAIVFSGIPFVDLDAIQALGFGSFREARDSFYRRAKLIYEADVELRYPDIARALILLSFWCDDHRVHKDAWYWAGCLASLIESCEPWNTLAEGSEDLMSKTLWWCCVARDAHVALAMRRPARLHRFHKNVPELITADLRSTGSFGHADENMREQKEASFILSTKLALIIADVLQPTLANPTSDIAASEALFQSCERDLIAWSVKFFASFPQAKQRSERGQSPLALVISVCLMTYDATINALYFPRVIVLRQRKGRLTEKGQSYSIILKRAASRTVMLLNEALSSEWASHIPTQFLTAILSAFPVFILELKSTRPSARVTGLSALKSCLGVLQHIQERFIVAGQLRQTILDCLLGMKIDPYGEVATPASSEGWSTASHETWADNMVVHPSTTRESSVRSDTFGGSSNSGITMLNAQDGSEAHRELEMWNDSHAGTDDLWAMNAPVSPPVEDMSSRL